MARPIWKGHISFGLVSIPVTLYSAELRSDLQFKLLDSRDKAQVRYERVNEVTGEEVPWKEIVKAFEFEDDNYVVIKEDDFKKVAPEAKAVEIEAFVPEDAIGELYFDKPYYLVPTEKGDRAYVLLREALRRAKKVGVARVVIRTRQYLAALLVHGDALVLAVLRFSQEVRKPTEFPLPQGEPKAFKIGEREIDLAVQLIESMAAPWEPEQYHDEYREALMEWIERKAKGEGTVRTPRGAEEEEVPAGEIVDFATLLKKSVEGRTAPKQVKTGPKPRKATAAKRKAT